MSQYRWSESMARAGERKFVVFLSHSGARSRTIAQQLNSMLAKVFKGTKVRPWISESIPPGEVWWRVIRGRLSEADFGIVCMTEENQLRPWIAFEAGAISKREKSARIVGYLID